jgi:hypothetical protein
MGKTLILLAIYFLVSVPTFADEDGIIITGAFSTVANSSSLQVDGSERTSSYGGNLMRAEIGFGFTRYSIVGSYETGTFTNRKSDVEEERSDSAYGIAPRFFIIPSAFLGAEYLISKIAMKPESDADYEMSGQRISAMAGYQHRFSPLFSVYAVGKYTLSAEYDKAEGEDLENKVKEDGFAVFVGVGVQL